MGLVGNRLKDFRKAHGLSPEQMAQALFISNEKYAALESNKDIPDEIETTQMASLLGVTKEYLQAGEYDLRKVKTGKHKYLHHTATGWTCTEKSCGWRQKCGDGVFYCPGKGCMKEQEEK